MASRRSNEGLEVVPQDPPRYPAKNYYEGDQSPHVVYGYPSPPPFEAKQYEENYPIPTSTEAQTYTPKKSSKLRLWWIIFAIFLVIAVVVGGAIKGLLAISKNKKNQVNANAPTAYSVHLHRPGAYVVEQLANEFCQRYPRSRMSAWCLP